MGATPISITNAVCGDKRVPALDTQRTGFNPLQTKSIRAKASASSPKKSKEGKEIKRGTQAELVELKVDEIEWRIDKEERRQRKGQIMAIRAANNAFPASEEARWYGGAKQATNSTPLSMAVAMARALVLLLSAATSTDR